MAGNFMAHGVTFGDFMAGNFMAGDFWADTVYYMHLHFQHWMNLYSQMFTIRKISIINLKLF